MHGLSSCAKGVRSNGAKLYIYGYLNRVQSSRRLEREAGRNVEVMWLLGRLAPEPSLETERTRPPCGFPYRSFLSTSSASLCHCLATSRNVSLASWSTVAAARASASSALRRYSSALCNMAITAASCRALRLAVFDSCNWDPAALPQQMPVSVGNHVQQDP